MAITHCTVHALRSRGASADVTTHFRDGELPDSGYRDELVREMKHVFIAKAGKQYGVFHPDSDRATVSRWIDEWQSERLGFDSLTRKISDHIADALRQADVEFDAYFLYAFERLADADYFYLFALRDQEGVYLDGDLNLSISRYLDPKGVVLGARLSLGDWAQAGHSSYLAVLRARGEKDMTDAFWNAIGFAEPRDTSAETGVFLDALSQFEQTLEPEAVSAYRHRVVDFCIESEQRGEAVELESLSQHLDAEQPKRFSEFVGGATSLPAAIYPERRLLKQYVRISGRNDLLSMSFAAECLGASVVYDSSEDQLVIRDIPAPLKLRLLRHMRQAAGITSDDAD